MSSQIQEHIVIASRYAKALFQLASEDGALKNTESEVVAFAELAAQSTELSTLIGNRTLPRTELQSAIAAIAKKAGYSSYFSRFLVILAEHRRLGIFAVIKEQFAKLCAESRGELQAEITSATPLSENVKKQISSALSDSTRKNINLQLVVNPAIKGGIIIRIGSRMLDRSVVSQLQQIKTLGKQAIASIQ